MNTIKANSLASAIEGLNEEIKTETERMKAEIASRNPTLWIHEPTNLARKKALAERTKDVL